MKGVYIFLADGFEDMEALGTLDVLRRGGIPVKTVSVTGDPAVTSSRGVTMFVDELLEDLRDVHITSGAEDVMIFPGGMPGSKTLASHKELIALMKEHYAAGGTVAAICAAPGLVLAQLPGVKGLKFTCFDGFEDFLLAEGAVYVPEGTVTDGRVITGRGAGHAIAFGLAILESLKGSEAVAKVKAGLML